MYNAKKTPVAHRKTLGEYQVDAEFLEAIRDPASPEHQTMLEWCGGAFDPSAFDPIDAQQRLDEIKL